MWCKRTSRRTKILENMERVAKLKQPWVPPRVYPKVSGLTAWSENCNWYSSLPLCAVVSLFCESIRKRLDTPSYKGAQPTGRKLSTTDCRELFSGGSNCKSSLSHNATSCTLTPIKPFNSVLLPRDMTWYDGVWLSEFDVLCYDLHFQVLTLNTQICHAW
jgi:hypothetical protein